LNDIVKIVYYEAADNQNGNVVNTGIFIPINDWNTITQMHDDLKKLVPIDPPAKQKLSDMAGKLSHETTEEMRKYVQHSRDEWKQRLTQQF